jgi:glycosyltransferase involved in cell wall biosynthesis
MFAENNPPEDPPYEITANTVTNRTKIGAVPDIYQVLRKHEDKTNLFHVFNPQYLGVAGLYSRYSDTPVVGRLNAYGGFCTNPKLMDNSCFRDCTLQKKIKHNEQEGINNAVRFPQIIYQHTGSYPTNYLDKIFALSPAIKNIYTENGINKDLIDIVPNFYDPNLQPTDEFNEANKDEFRITYVGRLREEKGPDILLDAVSKLKADELIVDLLGDGPLMGELKEHAQTLGIADMVNFHGWVDNSQVPNFLAQGDIFVHPGRWPEPFGRVILEAMQCNSPPVVSDIGAPPWIAGDAGVTFPRNDASELADQISELQGNPNILSELSRQCSKRLRHFAPGHIVRNIERQYRELY